MSKGDSPPSQVDGPLGCCNFTISMIMLLGVFDPDEPPISVDMQARAAVRRSEPDAKALVRRIFIPPDVPEHRE
ncbi:hypothetical protein PAXRUDRAFT_8153 [Paxillus rubicundulus Ve08.2h10]|uniref:Uncharacterized protein n=1 Tax=Paxillus rubicundulus Ve08.2h10 TaxID=930991 RepID=A0A0D0DXY8_9AGAM|nr:hypothetical protein PAXRUDRAFT_8153 [Paxillus rubicundulus Ve08.2h10]